MRLKVVYDTNVLVSANLKPDSLIASLVALAIGKQVRLFYSTAIFAEYEEVLRRPKFAFSTATVDTFLMDLQRTAKMVHPTRRLTQAPHEPDNRFLECAQAGKADYLVTGNKRHFPFAAFHKTQIVSPAAFARIVSEYFFTG